MSKIRVLIIEDSITIRKRFAELFGRVADFEVVGEAGDGKEGYEKCLQLRPDVVTMDMMLPEVSGLAATEFIMAYCPTPILIVSSSTNRGEVFKTYDALAAGAVDVIEKPDGTEPEGSWEDEFVATVRLVSRIKVITHLRARLQQKTIAPKIEFPQETDQRVSLVVMGASTGGPGALVKILSGIPAGFPLPILLVVHLAPMFANLFAEWLSTHSALPVDYARDGEPLPLPGRGRVMLAPPGKHLVIVAGRVRLTNGEERNSCRPSIDVLFESAARELGPSCLGCLLTGMGRDGAEGMLAIQKEGGMCVTQDEATSVVFGMPREAIRLGAGGRVLALDQIAPTLLAAAVTPLQTRGV